MPPIWVSKDADGGVVIGASIVSKATATEVGASGVKRQPWANAPFIPGALADYMENPLIYTSVAPFYEQKRNRFVDLVSGSRFTVKRAGGTYFQSLGYANITDEDDEAFAKRLTIEHKVASIPISVFYHQKRDDKMLRFCFAKGDDTLERAAEILCRI